MIRFGCTRVRTIDETVSRAPLEADLKTPLPRKLTFTDPEKIGELARRVLPAVDAGTVRRVETTLGDWRDLALTSLLANR